MDEMNERERTKNVDSLGSGNYREESNRTVRGKEGCDGGREREGEKVRGRLEGIVFWRGGWQRDGR